MSPRKKISRWFLLAGISLIGIGLLLLVITFLPIISVEIHYDAKQLHPKDTSDIQKPVNDAFGIIIPKIGANAAIIPNIDPYDSHMYQQALTKGVAHAKGSVFPDRIGNMFLFSHSSVNFYEALRFNSVFYLLNKLDKGDLIDIYFEKRKYTYQVTETKLVDPKDVSYLMQKTNDKLLTLMTCWPPGTTFQRLLVIAKMKED